MDPYKIILDRLRHAESTLRSLAANPLGPRAHGHIRDAAEDIGRVWESLERPSAAHAADLASSIMSRAIARGVGIDPDDPMATQPVPIPGTTQCTCATGECVRHRRIP